MSKAGYRYEPVSQGESPKDQASGRPNDRPPWWMNIWRGVNLIMTVFFSLAALVQINDPDPYLWVPAYVLPALFCLAIVVQPSVTLTPWWRHLVVTHMALSLAGSIYLLAVVVELLLKDIANPLIHEEGRELGGLVIVIGWLAICRFTTIGNPKPRKDSISALLLVTVILTLLPLAFWGLCFVDQISHKLGHCTDMFKGGLFSQATGKM